ncbi:MAG TPA: hypothetical protein VGP62_21530 [Bryobacteraceae bacterium]|jgi:hypothetical protein|nr:hypothetical protein [Bryobacteraceae bacterium]
MMLTLWIAWALLTVVVITLALYRKFATRNQDAFVHLAEAEAPIISQQVIVARKLDKIDFWGKTLTVLDVGFLVVLVGIVCYNAWRISLESIK